MYTWNHTDQCIYNALKTPECYIYRHTSGLGGIEDVNLQYATKYILGPFIT